MGNQQVMINYDSCLNFTQGLTDQLSDIGTLKHPSLGLIRLWQIKKNPQNLLFSFVLYSSVLDTSIMDIHQFRCTIQHPNLIKYYACFKETEIGGVEKQQYYFEYHPKTLKQMTKVGPLKEENIWEFVEQIVNAMEYLQRQNKSHGNLTTESIFIDQQNHIKLLDNLGQKRFNKTSVSQDTFQLGLIILEMMTQKTSQLNFSNSLKELIGSYSLQILQLTGRLLQSDEDMRPDFIELKNIIRDRFIIPITTKQSKIIKTEKGYSSYSESRISEQQEIEKINQQYVQQQSKTQTVYHLNHKNDQQTSEQKHPNILDVQHFIKSNQQNIIKKNSNNNHIIFNKQYLNSNLKQQPLIRYQLHHKQRYSLQLQSSQIKAINSSTNENLMDSYVLRPQSIHQNVDQKMGILTKIFEKQDILQNGQFKQKDMRSSINSSHSTQYYFSQNKKQTVSQGSFYNSTSSNKFQTIKTSSSKDFHEN